MQQRKLTMPKICGPNDFVKIKRAQSRFLDMVAQKSNRISGFDAPRFAHKITASCALSVKRKVPTLTCSNFEPADTSKDAAEAKSGLGIRKRVRLHEALHLCPGQSIRILRKQIRSVTLQQRQELANETPHKLHVNDHHYSVQTDIEGTSCYPLRRS